LRTLRAFAPSIYRISRSGIGWGLLQGPPRALEVKSNIGFSRLGT